MGFRMRSRHGIRSTEGHSLSEIGTVAFAEQRLFHTQDVGYS